jgi:hypothetical protein
MKCKKNATNGEMLKENCIQLFKRYVLCSFTVLVKIQIACLFINEIIGTFVDQRTGEILYGWVKAAEGTPGDA